MVEAECDFCGETIYVSEWHCGPECFRKWILMTQLTTRLADPLGADSRRLDEIEADGKVLYYYN
jgi:hypothetical protein